MTLTSRCAHCQEPFREGEEIRDKDHQSFHASKCIDEYTAHCRFLIQFQRSPTPEERAKLFERVSQLGRPPRLSWDHSQNELIQLFAA